MQQQAQAQSTAEEGEERKEELKDAVELPLDALSLDEMGLRALGGKRCLDVEIQEAREMVANITLETTDVLGLGGLLCSTLRLASPRLARLISLLSSSARGTLVSTSDLCMHQQFGRVCSKQRVDPASGITSGVS